MDDLREIFNTIQNKLNDLFNRVNQLEATPVILSGGGGGAPLDAQYLTLALNGVLTQERRFDPSARFTVVDGGAGADYDFDLAVSGVGAGAYGSATQVATFTVDTYGRLTLAANVAISGVPPLAHNILSAYHSDTLADNVVDGDIIIGNVTPRWSRLAIAIPAANVRNVLGIDNGELRPSWKTALDATNPSAITVGAAANPGTSLVFAHRDHTHATPATWTATAHNILDATYHSDTVTQAVTRGSLIYANATPKWDELNFPGAANYVLTTNATDVLWSTNTLNITGNSTINGSLVGNMTGSGTIATGGFTGTLPKTGTLPVGTGTAGRIAEWVTDVNTLQASTLIKSGAGVLTLSAGGAYTLTIPATGTTVLGTGTNTYVTYWNGTNTVTGDAGFTYVVATNSLTAGDYYTTDGGNFGISGNELLTVNAAGTFAFTGISGVTVEDADWIGNGAATARLGFDSSGATASAYFSSCNLGVGVAPASGKVQIGITDADGSVYLYFDGGRDWKFIQRGSGAGSALALQTVSATKSFYILNSVGATSLYLNYDEGTIVNSRIQLLPDGGRVSIATGTATASLSVNQGSVTGAIPVLDLKQDDNSEEMIDFIVAGTGAGYPVDTATAVGTPYARLRVAVNGTFKYIQLYNA